MLSKLTNSFKYNTNSKNGFYIVKGSFNYFAELVTNGLPPLQNCDLIVNVYTKSDKNFVVASAFKWFRIRGDRSYPLIGVNSNTYQLSSQDINSKIKVEIHPQEEDFKGIAIIEFGPVVIDPILKRKLESILVSGYFDSKVEIIQNLNRVHQCNILINTETIKFENKNENLNLNFNHSLENPQIEMNHLDTSKCEFLFISEMMENKTRNVLVNTLNISNNRLIIRFSDRNLRDLVTLAIKTLSTKSYLLNSKSISYSYSNFIEKSFKDDQNLINHLLEMENMKKEIIFLTELINKFSAERLNKKIKDSELNITKETFSKLINNNINTTSNKKNLDIITTDSNNEKELILRIKTLEDEKQELETKIANFNNKTIYPQRNDDGFFNESAIWVKEGQEAFSHFEASNIIPNNFENSMFKPEENFLKDQNQNLQVDLKEYKHQNDLITNKLTQALLLNENLSKELENAKNNIKLYNDQSFQSQNTLNYLQESGFKSIVNYQDNIYQENIQRLENILNQRKKQIEDLKSRILKLEKTNENLQDENELFKNRIQLFEDKGLNKNKDGNSSEQRLYVLQKENDSLRIENSKLQNENFLYLKELDKIKGDFALIKNNHSGKDSSRSYVNESLVITLERDNEDLRKSIKNLENLLDVQSNAKNKEIEYLRSVNSKLQSEVDEYRNLKKKNSHYIENSVLRSNNNSFSYTENNRTNLRDKIYDLENENKHINMEKDQLLVQMSKMLAVNKNNFDFGGFN